MAPNIIHGSTRRTLYKRTPTNNDKLTIYLLSFVDTPRKFIIAINLRGVSTKLNKYIVFTMQTYKKLKLTILSFTVWLF